VFSAGHDIRELPTNGRDPLTYNDPLRLLVRTIEHFPSPVIAMVEGSVWGGACELVMSCDLIIASVDSTFAITTAKMGVPYNISGIQNFLSTGGMPLCKEMLFTAQPLGVERLLARGIVSHAVPREELEAVTLELAGKIAKNSPLVVSLLKEELRLLSISHNLGPETLREYRPCGARCTTAPITRKAFARFLSVARRIFRDGERRRTAVSRLRRSCIVSSGKLTAVPGGPECVDTSDGIF